MERMEKPVLEIDTSVGIDHKMPSEFLKVPDSDIPRWEQPESLEAREINPDADIEKMPSEFLKVPDSDIPRWELSGNLLKDILPNEYLIKNKEDGLRRESEVEEDLKKQYPESEGYTVESEVYLLDKDGNIVKDPVTGEARRIDFVVIKDGKVIASIEVTSKTADKTEQSAKEARIREAGGNYIKDSDGNLIEIPSDVTTVIERRN